MPFFFIRNKQSYTKTICPDQKWKPVTTIVFMHDYGLTFLEPHWHTSCFSQNMSGEGKAGQPMDSPALIEQITAERDRQPFYISLNWEANMKGVSSHWAIGTMAFVSGVALGIAAGLLWAPQSGKRTREDLQDLATDTLDQAEEWIDTTNETVGDLLKKGKAAVGVS
jgi:hypothetical protein